MNYARVQVTAYEFAKHNSNHPYFRVGYDSIMKNLSYDYNIDDRMSAIAYSRGRMFAIWCKQNNAPRAVWRGAVPAETLVKRIAHAVQIRGTFV